MVLDDGMYYASYYIKFVVLLLYRLLLLFALFLHLCIYIVVEVRITAAGRKEVWIELNLSSLYVLLFIIINNFSICMFVCLISCRFDWTKFCWMEMELSWWFLARTPWRRNLLKDLSVQFSSVQFSSLLYYGYIDFQKRLIHILY
jgi:hypothetical protein